MAKCLRLHILCIIIIRVLITFGGPIFYSLPDEGVHTDADTLLAVNFINLWWRMGAWPNSKTCLFFVQ